MKIIVALFTLLTISVLHALEPGDLRCDWGKDPLGVDSAPPRLSWKLKADPGDPADARQTAWQILAASSEEKLAADTGDLWDSHRVAGNDQLHVPYAGCSLAASQQVFWKVRVWKIDGEPGAWSPPARWTMGLPTAADWGAARWLTDPELLKWRRNALGYRSQPGKRDDEVKWILIDLGQTQPIDSVVLHSLRHTVAENLGFPRRFKVEAASNVDFKDAVVIADQTAADFRNPWATRIEMTCKGGPITARYLRLTATRLRTTDGEICLALSQIVVRSGGKNVAAGATVTASDSIEDAKWSTASVVDGIGEPGVNPLANSTLLLRREFSLSSAVTRAVLHVSGLGECQVSLNGTNPAGDTILTTGWTRYDRTCLYQTLDVTRALKAGDNTLLRAKSLAALVSNIEGGGHAVTAVTAGDIGYRYVLRALAQAGRSDVVFAMVNQTDKPGYGYQLAQGATSLTEAWSALRSSSQNHFMLGQVTEWFYAGLAPDPQAPGWRNIIVRPQPAGDITSASASHETPLGSASVTWSIRDGVFDLIVRVLIGSTADISLPFGSSAIKRAGPGEHRFSVAR